MVQEQRHILTFVADQAPQSWCIPFASLLRSLCLRWGATDLLPNASGLGFSIKSIKRIEQGQVVRRATMKVRFEANPLNSEGFTNKCRYRILPQLVAAA